MIKTDVFQLPSLLESSPHLALSLKFSKALPVSRAVYCFKADRKASGRANQDNSTFDGSVDSVANDWCLESKRLTNGTASFGPDCHWFSHFAGV